MKAQKGILEECVKIFSAIKVYLAPLRYALELTAATQVAGKFSAFQRKNLIHRDLWRQGE